MRKIYPSQIICDNEPSYCTFSSAHDSSSPLLSRRQCEAASGSGDEQGSFRTCKACATAWTVIFFTCSHEEVKTKLSVAAHISCGKPNLLVEVVSLLAHSFIRDDGFDPLSKLPEMMVLIHYLSYSVGKGLQSFPIATRARLMI